MKQSQESNIYSLQSQLSDHKPPPPAEHQLQINSSTYQKSASNHRPSDIIFPPNEFTNIYFENQINVLQYLQKNNTNIHWYRNYKPDKKNCNHFRLTCKICKSFIRLRKYKQGFKVYKMQNKHVHDSKAFSRARMTSIKKIFDEIKNQNLRKNDQGAIIQKIYNSNELIAQVRAKISIDSATMCKIMKKFKVNEYSNFSEFLTQHNYIFVPIIQDEKQYFSSKIQEHFPEHMIIISPLMKQFYRKFGQSVSFHLIPNLISNKTLQNSNYKLGIFTGMSPYLTPVIFGFALISNNYSSTYFEIFKKFFNAVLSGEPKINKRKKENRIRHQNITQSLITDFENEPYISQAIGKLIQSNLYSGCHIYDQQSIIKHLTKGINVNLSNDLSPKIMKAIRTFSYGQWQFLDNYILEKIKSIYLPKQIQILMPQAQKSYFCCSPNKYFGLIEFRTKTSQFEKFFRNKFKDTSISINKFFIKFCKELESEFTGSVAGEEQKYNIPAAIFKELNNLVSEKIKEYLYNNYIRSTISWNVLSFQNQREFKVISRFENNHSNNNKPSNYSMIADEKIGESFLIKDGKCECQDNEKMGLPCIHILACANTLGTIKSLIPYINSRWLLQVSQTKRIDRTQNKEIIGTKRSRK